MTLQEKVNLSDKTGCTNGCAVYLDNNGTPVSCSTVKIKDLKEAATVIIRGIPTPAQIKKLERFNDKITVNPERCCKVVEQEATPEEVALEKIESKIKALEGFLSVSCLSAESCILRCGAYYIDSKNVKDNVFLAKDALCTEVLRFSPDSARANAEHLQSSLVSAHGLQIEVVRVRCEATRQLNGLKLYKKCFFPDMLK